MSETILTRSDLETIKSYIEQHGSERAAADYIASGNSNELNEFNDPPFIPCGLNTYDEPDKAATEYNSALIKLFNTAIEAIGRGDKETFAALYDVGHATATGKEITQEMWTAAFATVYKAAPHDLLVSHDELTNNLRRSDLSGGKAQFDIESGNTEITATSNMIVAQLNGVTIYGDFGPDEELTNQSAMTFYQAGKYEFTFSELYRHIHGNSKTKPNEKDLKDIENTLLILNSMYAHFDTSEIDPDYNGETKQILDIAIREPKTGTANKVCVFISKPAILDYAEKTGQIWKFKSKYREIRKVTDTGEIGKRIPLTGNRPIIVIYLYRRIETCRYKHNEAENDYKKYVSKCKRKKLPVKKSIEDFYSNYSKILFDLMFKELKLDGQDNKQKKRDKDFAIDCMKFWKVTGMIQDFDTLYAKRKSDINGLFFDP